MTTLFCTDRATDNCVKLGEYLTNQKHHPSGEIVATYDTFSEREGLSDMWQRLAEQNQRANQRKGNRGKTKETNIQEAREFFFWLPNSWYSENSEENKKMALEIAQEFKLKTGLDCVAAIHWNKERTNFHCHIMYADRKTLDNPIAIRATRNEYYTPEWKRCTKNEAESIIGSHVVKKGQIKEIKYFEEIKDTRATNQRSKFLNEVLKPWAAEYTGQQIFDRNSLYLPQQKVHKYYTKEAKAKIIEENRKIKEYNARLEEFLSFQNEIDQFHYDLDSIDTEYFETFGNQAFFGYYEETWTDLKAMKESYLGMKKSAITNSMQVRERSRDGKKVWRRKYDPEFYQKLNKTKFSQIDSMYSLLEWILNLLLGKEKATRWQKFNFNSWEIENIPNSKLAEIKVGDSILIVSQSNLRKNRDGTFDVFLDLDHELQSEGRTITTEELFIESGWLKDKGHYR